MQCLPHRTESGEEAGSSEFCGRRPTAPWLPLNAIPFNVLWRMPLACESRSVSCGLATAGPQDSDKPETRHHHSLNGIGLGPWFFTDYVGAAQIGAVSFSPYSPWSKPGNSTDRSIATSLIEN